MIGAETALACLAVDQWIGEPAQMTRCFPDLRMHEDRRVEADDIAAVRDHRTPPGLLDVALEFNAERTVIPATVETAVYFARLKDETPAFAKTDDGTHEIGGFGGHSVPPLKIL